MVGSFVSLSHRALDPKQESQCLRIIALASRSLLQLHMTGGAASFFDIGKDFIKSTLIRCGISTVFSHSTRQPSQELQDTLGGLIHTGFSNDERHFVSSGLFFITSKINNFLQWNAQTLKSAGYRNSALWVSRIATALKSDLSINAALTDAIISRRQAIDAQQVEPDSSDDESEIEEIELDPSSCEEECRESEISESRLDQESTDHLMEKPNEAPLSYAIEEHYPHNSWLGRPSKKADYVTVTVNGLDSTFPKRKWAEKYVQLMQRQQSLVYQGNNQSYQCQQEALYLGKSPSEIPPAQTQAQQSYRVTYNPTKEKIKVYINGESEPAFREKGKEAAKHAMDYIEKHINGHNTHIQKTVSAYTISIKASLPAYISPPKAPEYVYSVHKTKNSEGNKNTYTSYAAPVNGLGPSINLGEFKSREQANDWTKMTTDHLAQTHHLADAMHQAQAAYLKAGGSIEDIPPIPDLASHEFRLDTSKNKVRLYRNGKKIFKKPLESHPQALEDAIGKASTTLGKTNKHNRQIANDYIQNLKQKSKTPLPIETVGQSDHKPLQEQLMDINTKNKGSEKEHGFWYHAWRWPFQKADQATEWLDDHGVTGTVAFSKTMPLYSEPKAPTKREENQHHLILKTEELARMEQSEPAQPNAAYATPAHTFHTEHHPMQYAHHHPSSHPEPEMTPVQPQPKKPGELPILEKYEDEQPTQSYIPTWLRWGANPDRTSLDPKEEIEAQHSQLAALSTSVARFIGGIFDFFTNRDRSINVDTQGNPIEIPTLTEKLEDLAERAIPYDRTQPGFNMLQTTSDLVVSGTGGYMMGGPVRSPSGRTGVVQEIETTAQRAMRTLAEERVFLEEVNQPAYRSGFGSRSRHIKSDRVIHAGSDNPSHLVFCENGKTKTISFADLSDAGTKTGKGKLSTAGRALQKKTDRLDSVFPKPKGTPEEVSRQGQKVLDEILNHPDRVVIQDATKKRYGDVFDIKIGSEKGPGVRFKTNGEFVGFLEPKQ
ncbi:hypothetical protein [Simkania sp.]|uniref:hypothetical protein n=1 Tax=Simkania sp. TaxID=34094 RepID=UPI003B521EC3